MNPLLAAVTGSALTGGPALLVAGARRTIVPAAAAPSRADRWRHRLTAAHRGSTGRQRLRLLLAVTAGVLGWQLTGLALLGLLTPLAVLGIPRLLAPPPGLAQVARLEALEEWTRNLTGVLAVGVGLEQALTASLRSTPAPIRPAVTVLVARLTARWDTTAALRAFADDLDSATGDLVCASLVLSAQRRGAGLVGVLEGLSASVAQDVQVRRAIEADRAKPRSTARAVTLITMGALLLLLVNRSYMHPYASATGQLLLAALIAGYVGTLIWMRQMTKGAPAPRFLNHPGHPAGIADGQPRVARAVQPPAANAAPRTQSRRRPRDSA